jgi:NitT/TauT family transport system substrate-binding protein
MTDDVYNVMRLQDGPKEYSMARRFLFVLVITCCLAAIGGAPAAVQARPARWLSAHLTTVKVGYVPIVDFLPLYVAINQGYFTQQRLKADLVPMAGGATIIPALQGGSLDLGISNPLSVLIAADRGLSPLIVSAGSFEDRARPTHAILVANGSSIHSAADLEGKTVAVPTLNSLPHIAVEQWMKDHGADPSRVRFTELTVTEMLAALTHGQIDAAIEAEPFIKQGEAIGARVLAFPFAEANKLTYTAGIVALRPYVVAHKSLVARFSRAYNRAIDFIESHDAQARAILAKYGGIPRHLAATMNLPVWKKHTKTSFLQYWLKVGQTWHLVTRNLNVTQLLWQTAK